MSDGEVEKRLQRAEQFKRERDRCEGAEQEMKRTLRKKFGLKSLEEANSEDRKLAARLAELDAKIDRECQKFDELYGDKLK